MEWKWYYRAAPSKGVSKVISGQAAVFSLH
jgi:hypothetical protein